MHSLCAVALLRHILSFTYRVFVARSGARWMRKSYATLKQLLDLSAQLLPDHVIDRIDFYFPFGTRDFFISDPFLPIWISNGMLAFRTAERNIVSDMLAVRCIWILRITCGCGKADYKQMCTNEYVFCVTSFLLCSFSGIYFAFWHLIRHIAFRFTWKMKIAIPNVDYWCVEWHFGENGCQIESGECIRERIHLMLNAFSIVSVHLCGSFECVWVWVLHITPESHTYLSCAHVTMQF